MLTNITDNIKGDIKVDIIYDIVYGIKFERGKICKRKQKDRHNISAECRSSLCFKIKTVMQYLASWGQAN